MYQVINQKEQSVVTLKNEISRLRAENLSLKEEIGVTKANLNEI